MLKYECTLLRFRDTQKRGVRERNVLTFVQPVSTWHVTRVIMVFDWENEKERKNEYGGRRPHPPTKKEKKKKKKSQKKMKMKNKSKENIGNEGRIPPPPPTHTHTQRKNKNCYLLETKVQPTQTALDVELTVCTFCRPWPGSNCVTGVHYHRGYSCPCNTIASPVTDVTGIAGQSSNMLPHSDQTQLLSMRKKDR